ncbi:unnamed protein product [Knipowitschia caucasica]
MDRVVLMKLSVIFQQQLLCLQSAESECLKAKERRIRQYAAARRRRLRRVMLMQRQINTVFLARMGTMSSKRSVWVRQKSDAWWRQVVSEWTDSDWRANFRMLKNTFNILCDLLRPQLQRQTMVRRPLSVERRVALCLWRLATGDCFRTISNLFGIGKSTAVTVTNEVCSAIASTLLPLFIKTPSLSEFRAIAQGFRDRWGFPQCAGAIDGTHIPIKAPQHAPSEYYNRKGFYSIILQGVVDYRLRFWDINVGWPGKVHNARVFSESSIFREGQSGTLLPNITETFAGTEVPLVILGGSAYPLQSWVMKPYPDHAHTTPAQLHFNYRLSRARMTVERAFGRLKGRWRCLMTRNDGQLENMNDVVAACCVLHNFCEDNSECCEDLGFEDNEPSENPRPHVDVAIPQLTTTATANTVRDALCSYLFGLPRF